MTTTDYSRKLCEICGIKPHYGVYENFGDLKNLTFNIIKIEGLRDRDAFSDLIRGILVVKEVENVQR